MLAVPQTQHGRFGELLGTGSGFIIVVAVVVVVAAEGSLLEAGCWQIPGERMSGWKGWEWASVHDSLSW